MPKSTPSSASIPTEAQVEAFDRLEPMLAAAHKELSELSKKKQDGILNELKVRHVNRLLEVTRDALGGDPNVAFLEMLDEESLPENSDAVFILSQWLAAMSQFRERHHGWDGVQQRWFTAEHPRR